MNNEAAVNFISNKPTLLKQYSRLKFYLAPNNEGMVDAIFSVNPFKKINVTLKLHIKARILFILILITAAGDLIPV